MIDSLYYCDPSHSALIHKVFENNPEVLIQARFDLEAMETSCSALYPTFRHMYEVRSEAETTWLRGKLTTWLRGMFERTEQIARTETTAAAPTGHDLMSATEELLVNYIGVPKTSIRCPECPKVEVLEVLDGGTLETERGMIRLYGVEAPKKGKRCYGTAGDNLRILTITYDWEFYAAMPEPKPNADALLPGPNPTILVESGPEEMDASGIPIYYAYTMSGDSIDEILVRMGIASASSREGQHLDELQQIWARAPKDKKACYRNR